MEKTIALLFLLGFSPLAFAQTTTPVTIPAQTIQVPTVPGAAGKNGTNGTNGANGATGATGPAGAAGPIGLTGPAGPVGPQGAPGTGDASGTGSAVCSATGPYRIIPTTGQVANDSVSTSSAAFVNTIPVAANAFTAPGQMIHLVATFELAKGISGGPQLQLQLDGSAPLSPAAGLYIGSATDQAWEWQADIWITAVTVGTSGTIEVHGKYVEQTQDRISNQISGGVSPFPNTLPFAFDTTKAHTLGFATGTFSFDGGSIQQRPLLAMFWP